MRSSSWSSWAGALGALCLTVRVWPGDDARAWGAVIVSALAGVAVSRRWVGAHRGAVGVVVAGVVSISPPLRGAGLEETPEALVAVLYAAIVIGVAPRIQRRVVSTVRAVVAWSARLSGSSRRRFVLAACASAVVGMAALAIIPPSDEPARSNGSGAPGREISDALIGAGIDDERWRAIIAIEAQVRLSTRPDLLPTLVDETVLVDLERAVDERSARDGLRQFPSTDVIDTWGLVGVAAVLALMAWSRTRSLLLLSVIGLAAALVGVVRSGHPTRTDASLLELQAVLIAVALVLHLVSRRLDGRPAEAT